MPRLLLLCEYPTLNGGERSMLATLGGVRQAGFDVAVAVPPAGPLAEGLRRRDVEVIAYNVRDIAGNRRPLDTLREELAALLTRRRPDLLHSNSLSMGRLAGPVALESNLPSLAHLRDILRLSRRAVADLNCHGRLLAVSQATKDFHITAGLDAGKTHVLHNGIDLEEFHPRPPAGYLHRELGLEPGTLLVGTIGQIGLRKGQDVLARAMATVAEHRGDVHWLIVGERFSEKEEARQFEAELRAAARRGLPQFSLRENGTVPFRESRIHLLGFRGDVPRLLNELTLLVHPARQEPLGRVLLEAAAAGVAVIATDVGGTREVFPGEADAAVLVPPDDAETLAARMLELLADETRRRRLGAAARRRAEGAFDARIATTGLLAHYHAVLPNERIV